jgi:hypothetical protein
LVLELHFHQVIDLQASYLLYWYNKPKYWKNSQALLLYFMKNYDYQQHVEAVKNHDYKGTMEKVKEKV